MFSSQVRNDPAPCNDHSPLAP
ncbi:protein of unknown function [Azospirillum baldaniorum]|uniref:Uncharacterized protein n=1 Tax=Azospirillum baldaniorum TaxID=1064539 RepID=A0A9P1JS76_9PROT|nr:protein of unknown function [Azospirillum baldaniorum]